MTKPVELIEHALTTMILDAVQFFPQNKKKVNKECHGLIFGVEKESSVECDFAFPVGSVEKSNSFSVQPDEKVDTAISSAQQLFSTSTCLATFHSHPYEEEFEEWADPSNGDCGSANYLNLPYFFIIAIKRTEKIEKPLTIYLQESDGNEFIYNSSKAGNEPSDYKTTGKRIRNIQGEFLKYFFEIRCYKNTGKSLVDVDLISSEANLIKALNDQKIMISDLTNDDSYSLRKLEYNLRKEREEKGKGNLKYHLGKIIKENKF